MQYYPEIQGMVEETFAKEEEKKGNVLQVKDVYEVVKCVEEERERIINLMPFTD